MTVAGEVVTLAEVSGHDFLRVVGSHLALTLSTDTISSVVTENFCGVISPAALKLLLETQVCRRTFTVSTKVIRGTFTDSAFVGSHVSTMGALLFIARVSCLFTVTATNHLQINYDGFIDANWRDQEPLLPFSGVLRTFQHLDFGRKCHLGTNF